MKRAIITVSFVMGMLVLTGPTGAEEPLTFEKAVEIGLLQNYSIRIARNEAKVAENNRGLGAAGFLPKVDLSGSMTKTDASETSNSPNSFGDSETDNNTAQVALQWTLFDGFRMFADNLRYRELARLGEAQARTTIEGTVLAIGAAFFDLVQQDLLLDVARRTRDISADRLRQSEVRRDIGGASSTDYLNAQVAYNRDAASLLNQELTREESAKAMNLLLGRAADEPLQVVQTIDIVPFDLVADSALDLAMEHNSLLRLQRSSEQAALMSLRASRSPFMPKVYFNASYGYTDRKISPDAGGEFNTETSSSTLGLSAAWNLFNGRRDQIAAQNARITLNNQRLAVRDTENQVRGDLIQALETFQRQLDLVELERQNLRAAEQQLQLQRDRLEVGGVSSLEFRDAQTALVQAQTSLISAQYRARLTRLNLDRLVGRLLGDKM